MNKTLLAAGLTFPLLLAGCQTAPKAPADHDVTGTITGEWREGAKLRLNLVGVGFPTTVTSTSNLKQNVSAGEEGWTFGVDLPAYPNLAGVYQIAAFDDTSGDATYDPGEQFARNTLYLVFSPATTEVGPWTWEPVTIPKMNVERGWNLYDSSEDLGAAKPRSVTKVTSYNLHRGKTEQ
ncbi:hypothetical protein [Deinococcus radiophilus]|uniref:hypothetical protein n=1 Tax=Deinococcus radiophilus TaxID=32062 RepID=UPI001E41519A|nr:hypothetical protein [Deinococcus radiophilus]UFA49751.1 hypothetical protein LMT64_07570 [Deinococcus radiophilus]